MVTKEGNRLQIIGVLDLRGGRAVHARAGARDRYSAVQNAAGWPIDPGNARTLAEIYTDVLGVSDIYAADLDAILERRPQEDVTKDLASMSAPLWLDAGVRSVDDARRAIELGASRVIVGLETLPSFEVLSNICTALGNEPVVFSLDLRDGEPMVTNGVQLPSALSPESIAKTAASSGVGTLIVIDLARVGTGRGLDVDLLETDPRSGSRPESHRRWRSARVGRPRARREVGLQRRAPRDGASQRTHRRRRDRRSAEALTQLPTPNFPTPKAESPEPRAYFPSTENARSTLPGMKPIVL